MANIPIVGMTKTTNDGGGKFEQKSAPTVYLGEKVSDFFCVCMLSSIVSFLILFLVFVFQWVFRHEGSYLELSGWNLLALMGTLALSIIFSAAWVIALMYLQKKGSLSIKKTK